MPVDITRYPVQQFPPMNPLIIIPVYNEWPHLRDVLDSLETSFSHLLVVDDGSEERDYLLLLKEKMIQYLSIPFNTGHWAAIQAGFRYAIYHGFNAAVSFDGDGQHLAAEIPSILHALDDGYDIVVGGDITRAGMTKRWCWQLMNLFSELDIKDITSGFRVYNRKAMESLLSPACLNLEYQDLGVLFTAKTMGLRIGEVPVRMAARSAQKSRVFPGAFSILRYLIITMIFILARKL